MKKLIYALTVSALFASCATLQSVVRSTFPYTSTLIIPASSSTSTNMSVSSSASSFDQIFTGQGTNTSQVSQADKEPIPVRFHRLEWLLQKLMQLVRVAKVWAFSDL